MHNTELVHETELTAALRPVLSGELAATEELVVHERRQRNRSTLFFVGVPDGGRRPRWVVKVPNIERNQADLRSPLTAEAQFHTVSRLHDYLQARAGGRVSTPRPVATLPSLGAWVMEFAHGRTVADVAGPKALVRPRTLRPAMEAAALALRELHGMEEKRCVEVDLAALEEEAVTTARRHLSEAGLPARESWFGRTATSGMSVEGREVVLHGDWVPENVLLSPSTIYCLDPELTHRDLAEHDVVRFLMMLFDAPMFVVGGNAPLVHTLRSQAAGAFLSAYYAPGSPPPTLRPLMLAALAARWRARHEDVAGRGARLRTGRQALVRRHFRSFLDEVSSLGWPVRY